MKQHSRLLLTLCAVALSCGSAAAQVASNPPYTIEQSLIASGGGTSASANNTFKIEGAIGQPVAGTAANSPFTLRSGFFTPEPLAPTAASVHIEGRVRMANGKGVRNVKITLTEADGSVRTALSSINGKYIFTDVAVGQTIILSASAKRFNFSQPTQMLSLMEAATGIDFIASEQWIAIQ